MELHPLPRPYRRGRQPQGDEGPQMLGLNRRLETYLRRVQQLEGENQLLSKEIQGLRQGHQEARCSRTGLDKELQQMRAEVEAAWRDRDRVELEACCLAQELQDLGQQRRWVAEAQLKAQAQLKDSAWEMEEEQRAHMWLCEKVDQLEQEIHVLTQSHQEDIGHLEASMTSARHAASAPFPGPGQKVPSLLELGQEYTTRVTQAWAEAAKAYESQVSRLEESLDQARSQLAQVGQEQGQSQQKLCVLEKELAMARDVAADLERTSSLQRDTHNQELQHLQAHLQELEWEKGELGEQMDSLLEDSQRLLQHKMALGLEVNTYRALLDNESLKGRRPAVKAPRNVYITDVASSPKGMRSNYRTQVSRQSSSLLSSFNGLYDKSRSPASTTTSRWTPKSTMCDRIPPKHPTSLAGDLVDDGNTEKHVTRVTSYPKIQPNGTEEHFRPQEVHEEVTYAEPLSPPNEQEALDESLVTTRYEKHTEADNKREEDEEDWRNVVHEPTMESPAIESLITCKVESGFNSFEPAFNTEVKQRQIPSEETVAYPVAAEERSSLLLDESNKDVDFDVPAEKKETYLLHTPFDAWVEPVQASGDTSDSETEAVLEPTVDSNTSDPASEGECEESIFDQVGFNQEENASGVHTDGSPLHKVQSEVEDKLYPDGEEMDTWDSVIERKLKKEHSLEMDTRHAEPEDVSAREPGQQEVTKVNVQIAFTEEHVHSSLSVSPTGTQLHGDTHQITLLEQGQENVNNEEDDEEDDDSQNVSVSWRTELESDSYAQDTTLADTRPLIRYKSDETDGNTQASHYDESESSDGEDKMEAGGTGSGSWSDGKSKRFGTMEDLCEETEEEVEEVGYDMSYTHDIDDQDVVTKEHTVLRTDGDEEREQVQMVMKVDREHSDEETEDLTQLAIPKIHSEVNVDYSEDLEDVDRLVELELEGLSTATYSAHFAHHQASKSELATSTQETTPQGAGETTGEETFVCAMPSMKTHQEPISTHATANRPNEQLFLEDEHYVDDEDNEARNYPEIMEEDNDRHVPMVTRADATEDESVSIDFHGGFDGQEIIADSHMEQSNSSGDESPNVSPYPQPISTELGYSDLQDALVESVYQSEAPLKHSVDVDTDQQVFSEAAHTMKWEVLGSPIKATEAIGQFAAGQRCENVEAATESNVDFPDTMQGKRDILQVKNSTESIKTNYNGKDLHSFFDSDVNADIWGCSVLTGANYQPTSSYHEATGELNQSCSLGDNLVLGHLDNQHVAMGMSKLEGGSSRVQVTKEEFQQRSSERYERKDAAEKGLTHSEDSEEEGNSWSSGEE